MASFLDPIDPRLTRDDDRLRVVRIGEQPTLLHLFTTDVEPVRVHYCKDDPELVGPIVCPGLDCPECYLQHPPQAFNLLPVLNIASDSVEVLMISERLGDGLLRTELRLAHARRQSEDVLYAVSRQKFRYRAEARRCAELPDKDHPALNLYATMRSDGVKLATALTIMSARELADADSIRRQLTSVGGYPVSPVTQQPPLAAPATRPGGRSRSKPPSAGTDAGDTSASHAD